MTNVITKRELIERVAQTWREQYYDTNTHRWYDEAKERIYQRLAELQNPTAEAIDAIIGNGSWTSLRCNACHEDREAIYCFDVTGGEYTTYICAECLQNALNELKAVIE